NGVVLAHGSRIVPPRPAADVAAVENHLRDPLRMARGVGDADRRARRDPQEREWLLDLRGVHDRLEIPEPAGERQLGDVPGRYPPAGVVPAQGSEMVAEEAEPVPPDRALQLVLEMREPVRRLDQERTRADVGPGQLNAVFRAKVTDALAKLRIHGLVSNCS